jgi:hypothetical protein
MRRSSSRVPDPNSPLPGLSSKSNPPCPWASRLAQSGVPIRAKLPRPVVGGESAEGCASVLLFPRGGTSPQDKDETRRTGEGE